jgi:hypothetical protein
MQYNCFGGNYDSGVYLYFSGTNSMGAIPPGGSFYVVLKSTTTTAVKSEIVMRDSSNYSKYVFKSISYSFESPSSIYGYPQRIIRDFTNSATTITAIFIIFNYGSSLIAKNTSFSADINIPTASAKELNLS